MAGKESGVHSFQFYLCYPASCQILLNAFMAIVCFTNTFSTQKKKACEEWKPSNRDLKVKANTVITTTSMA